MNTFTDDAPHVTDGARPAAIHSRSTGELVKLLSEQVSVLARDELKLAQLEMTRKGKQAGTGAGIMGGGGLIALYGIGCLVACAVIAIAGVIAPWLAALIVGAALLAVAAITALLGRARLRKATPPLPEDTVASIRTDVDVIRQRTHR